MLEIFVVKDAPVACIDLVTSEVELVVGEVLQLGGLVVVAIRVEQDITSRSTRIGAVGSLRIALRLSGFGLLCLGFLSPLLFGLGLVFFRLSFLGFGRFGFVHFGRLSWGFVCC